MFIYFYLIVIELERELDRVIQLVRKVGLIFSSEENGEEKRTKLKKKGFENILENIMWNLQYDFPKSCTFFEHQQKNKSIFIKL